MDDFQPKRAYKARAYKARAYNEKSVYSGFFLISARYSVLRKLVELNCILSNRLLILSRKCLGELSPLAMTK